MKVTLLHHTPLSVCSHAIRTCWQSFAKGDNGGDTDKELIARVGNKYKHTSTLEHLVYNFYIQGISRACLQELARHRMASLSVKSTRYTLKELKHEPSFVPLDEDCLLRVSKYIVTTGDTEVDAVLISSLESLRELVANKTTDIAKYSLPECYKTELTWSINARSLQNFLTLRSSPRALWEIRDLSKAIFDAIPDEHKFIFEKANDGHSA